MLSKINELNEIIQPAVESVGYIFWGCEYHSNGKYNTLRVFIDHENGINVDDCEKASHQISAVMDVENLIKTEYDLEVSSPGVERTLFVAEHYKQYEGDEIRVRLKRAIEGRRKFRGVLKNAQENNFQLVTYDGTMDLTLDDIEKATLVCTKWD